MSTTVDVEWERVEHPRSDWDRKTAWFNVEDDGGPDDDARPVDQFTLFDDYNFVSREADCVRKTTTIVDEGYDYCFWEVDLGIVVDGRTRTFPITTPYCAVEDGVWDYLGQHFTSMVGLLQRAGVGGDTVVVLQTRIEAVNV